MKNKKFFLVIFIINLNINNLDLLIKFHLQDLIHFNNTKLKINNDIHSIITCLNFYYLSNKEILRNFIRKIIANFLALKIYHFNQYIIQF